MVFSKIDLAIDLSYFETVSLIGIGRFDLILPQTDQCDSTLGIEIDSPIYRLIVSPPVKIIGRSVNRLCLLNYFIEPKPIMDF